ncbi:MAG: LON peptidase substrate-binding domain-containing protein [Verrucomicrobia bacterium]|nr:LON peptidase substrate-binding domain-containing protein [Verrucomicrobiota bacterium]
MFLGTLKPSGLGNFRTLASVREPSRSGHRGTPPPKALAHCAMNPVEFRPTRTTVRCMETLHVPETLPVMTLPNTVFFPQALLPLHIFEARYREMLVDVLASNRLFAVARLDAEKQDLGDETEPLPRIASVGIVRACQKNDNDTSNLLLQGVCRVEVKSIVSELPYRVIAVRPLATSSSSPVAELEVLRLEVMKLLNLRRRLGTPSPKGMTQFLDSIDDIDTFADVAAFNLCDDSPLKQRLLETLDTRRRLQLFAAQLKSEVETQRLRRKLQGRLTDDGIANN